MKKLLLLILLAGCEQSYREAWQTICEAPAHATAKDPAERAHQVAEWTKEHVTNERARKELAAIAGIEGDRSAIIRETLREAGIDPNSCAILK